MWAASSIVGLQICISHQKLELSQTASLRQRVGAELMPPACSLSPVSCPLTRDPFTFQDTPGLTEVERAMLDNDKQQVAQALGAVEGDLYRFVQRRVGQPFHHGGDLLVHRAQMGERLV